MPQSTLTEAAIKDIVFAALRKIAPEAILAQLDPGENLREALDIDSFDFLNLMIALNERLHLEIPESDYGKLSTLADLLGYLVARAR